MREVVDIVHSITYEVQEQELQKAVKTVQGNISGIENLTKRQIALAKRYNETAVQDEKTRARITNLINRNSTALNNHKKSLEDNLINNKSLNKAMQQELGLIGAVEKKLSILKRARQTATSPQEIARYNNLIAQQQAKINKPQAQNIPKGGGLPNALAGSVGRLIPAIGGALAIGNLSGQIKDITQQFEKYRTVLRNTFQSSTKANQEFAKIQDFAAKTPYSVDELTGSFVKLVNRGFNPTKEELTNMGDIAASQGKSFDQLTEAVLDAQTGEFERLKEFGIKAKTTGDIVTLSFKGVEKQVKKTDEEALRKAVISFGQLQGVAGGMAAQSATLEGKLSNLGDSFDALFANIGSNGVGVFGKLIDITKQAVDWFNEFIETSPADVLREEQVEVNALISGIITLNEHTDARSMLITELNSKYPELLKNIDLEKLSQDQLKNFLIAVNNQYRERIRLAELQYRADKLQEKRQNAVAGVANVSSNSDVIALLEVTGQRDKYDLSSSLKDRQKILSNIVKNLTDKQVAEFNKITQRNSIWTRADKGWFSAFIEQVINPQLEEGQKGYDFYQKEQEVLNNQLGLIENEERKRFEQLKKILVDRKAYNQELDKLNDGVNLINEFSFDSDKNDEAQAVDFNRLYDKFGKAKNEKKTDVSKGKGKQKTASELALDDIDKRQKIEEEKQKQAYEKQLSELKKALEQKLITQEYYNHVAQEYSDVHNIALLNIEKKYDNERLKYLKEAEKEATKTKIANIDNSVKDIQLALRSRSEQLLKEAIDNAKKLDEELSNLLTSEEQREIDAVNKKFADSKAQLSGTKTLDELLIADADLIGAEESLKNANISGNKSEILLSNQRIETAKKRIDQLKQILKKETQLTEQEEIERQTAILEIQDKYFEKRESEATKRAISALNEYNYYEQQKFDAKFNQTDDEGVNVVQAENDIKLEQLKNANTEIIDEETLSNRKRLKLEEERAKNSEEIARRTQLAIQFIEKDETENLIAEKRKQIEKLNELEKTASEYSKTTIQQTKDKIEKELSDLLANLGLTQRQIEELFTELGKSSQQGLSQTTEGIFQLTDAFLSAATSIVSALESMVDKEIEIRERRVEKANEIADRGNAEALQIEEERLRKAQAQKEKYARAQMAINLAQQASSSALAIAEAAAAGGGWGSVALIAAVISALAAGYSTVAQMNQPQGFKEGVIGLNGKGSETSDSIPAMLSRGESVITAKGTKIGDNSKILEAMNNGVAFTIPSTNAKSPDIVSMSNTKQNDTKKLEQKLDGVIQAVENIKPSKMVFDKDGIAIITGVIEDKRRRRNKL